jgi:hypothetical protein
VLPGAFRVNSLLAYLTTQLQLTKSQRFSYEEVQKPLDKLVPASDNESEVETSPDEPTERGETNGEDNHVDI